MDVVKWYTRLLTPLQHPPASPEGFLLSEVSTANICVNRIYYIQVEVFTAVVMNIAIFLIEHIVVHM
jgi:hypothetical protein